MHAKATGDVVRSCGLGDGDERVSSTAGKLFCVLNCSAGDDHSNKLLTLLCCPMLSDAVFYML